MKTDCVQEQIGNQNNENDTKKVDFSTKFSINASGPKKIK